MNTCHFAGTDASAEVYTMLGNMLYPEVPTWAWPEGSEEACLIEDNSRYTAQLHGNWLKPLGDRWPE